MLVRLEALQQGLVVHNGVRPSEGEYTVLNAITGMHVPERHELEHQASKIGALRAHEAHRVRESVDVEDCTCRVRPTFAFR